MSGQLPPFDGELYRRICIVHPRHAWLYRASGRVAPVASIFALAGFGTTIGLPIPDWFHHRWAGWLYYLAPLTLAVPLLGIAWWAAILHRRLYLRYHAPNHALQRTEAGGGASSDLHA